MQLDVLDALRRWQELHAWMLPDLARALTDGGDSVVALVDDLCRGLGGSR